MKTKSRKASAPCAALATMRRCSGVMGCAGGQDSAADERLWLFAIEGAIQRAVAAESRAARQVVRMVISETIAVEASRIRRLGFNTLQLAATGRSSTLFRSQRTQAGFAGRAFPTKRGGRVRHDRGVA